MSQQIKFYRTRQLPTIGEVGGIYFLTGDNPTLWVYTNDGWENYASGGSSIETDLAGYAKTVWVTEELSKIWKYLDWDSDESDGGVSDMSILETEVVGLNTNSNTVIGAINELQQFINTLFTTVEVIIDIPISQTDTNPYINTPATLTDLTSGNEYTELINDEGVCSFAVAKGHEYKVSLIDAVHYYRAVGNPVRTATKTNETYVITVDYCTDDRFLVMDNGRIFTWNDYLNIGQLPSGRTAMFLRIGNSVLNQHNASFYLPVNLMKSVLPSTKNWGGSDTDDLADLANATTYTQDTGEYDMERNTNIIINAYGSNCAAYLATQKVVTINGVSFSGLLGTAEQYMQLYANNTEIQGWLSVSGLSTNYFSSGLAGWTSSEHYTNKIRARIVVSGGLSASPKVREGGISVLPFYKDIHKV